MKAFHFVCLNGSSLTWSEVVKWKKVIAKMELWLYNIQLRLQNTGTSEPFSYIEGNILHYIFRLLSLEHVPLGRFLTDYKIIRQHNADDRPSGRFFMKSSNGQTSPLHKAWPTSPGRTLLRTSIMRSPFCPSYKRPARSCRLTS